MSSYDSWKARSDRDDSLDGDPIFIECEACGGEGRKLESGWVYEHGCGFPHRDAIDVGPCPRCDGMCSEEISGEPITLEDLEMMQ